MDCHFCAFNSTGDFARFIFFHQGGFIKSIILHAQKKADYILLTSGLAVFNDYCLKNHYCKIRWTIECHKLLQPQTPEINTVLMKTIFMTTVGRKIYYFMIYILEA